MKQSPRPRGDFKYFTPITTRWADNDVYGHVNNVTYYAWFDTAVNRMLIERADLDIHSAPEYGVVVETGCQYFKSVAYPQNIEVGLVVADIGNRSVRYDIGIFSDDDVAIAQGHFIQVYISRETQASVSIPDSIRTVLTHLQGS